jgi:hypothetical protein
MQHNHHPFIQSNARAETIDDNNDPEWAEPATGGFLIVNDVQQLLDVSIFDADPVAFDDLLGRFVQPISDIVDVLNSDTPAGDFIRKPTRSQSETKTGAVINVNDRNDTDRAAVEGRERAGREDIDALMGAPVSWAQGMY